MPDSGGQDCGVREMSYVTWMGPHRIGRRRAGVFVSTAAKYQSRSRNVVTPVSGSCVFLRIRQRVMSGDVRRSSVQMRSRSI